MSGMFVQTQHVCGAAGQAESPGLVVVAGVTWVIEYRDQGLGGNLIHPVGLVVFVILAGPHSYN